MPAKLVPAKAGSRHPVGYRGILDSGFRRNDVGRLDALE